MALIVSKFGGTSVASPERIKNVAKRLIAMKQQGNDVVAVVSAMGKTTDELVGLAAALNDHPSKREMDMLLSTGEQVSMSLLAMAIQALGYNSVSFTGWQEKPFLRVPLWWLLVFRGFLKTAILLRLVVADLIRRQLRLLTVLMRMCVRFIPMLKVSTLPIRVLLRVLVS